MNKDWSGDKNSIYKTMGASSHTDAERETNDYYATEPAATKSLLKLETLNRKIKEPACGGGHMSEVLIAAGHEVESSDLIDRGYGDTGIDFLSYDNILPWPGDIVTNPPYKYAEEFVVKALSLVQPGAKVCFFLKLLFLEGLKRKSLFQKYPPVRIWVSSRRLLCAKNGEFDKKENDSRAVAYAWFIWEKGFAGDPVIKWF